jgi:hypothetical protein
MNMDTLSAKAREIDSNPHARKAFEEARDAVMALGDALNGGSKDVILAGILEGMMRTHRYLSNEMVIALLTAMGEFGSLPESSVSDARNSFAFKLCGKVRENFSDELFWRDK